MPPTQATPAAEPATLQEEFDRFLSLVYPDPPSPDDPHPAVRRQYDQVFVAFFSGFISGAANPGRWDAEVDDFVRKMEERVALAEAQGARS